MLNLRWAWIGCLALLVAPACSDDDGGNAGSGGASAGSGGTSSGKGGASSGKGGGSGDVVLIVSGELDTAQGEGTYHYEISDGANEFYCDVDYTVSGATTDPSCSECTFAYSLPLSAPVVKVGGKGCDGSDMLDGTSAGMGHMDPSTLMLEKSGTWSAIDGGDSQVMGDTWTFSLVISLAGEK